ncbi:MAG: AarF/UbiB family protein [Methylobacter sp.]|uniref:ABC1 kinase family protein n=1 Tax=Methylobacter sp. TaxID=2051955 RepID=UPI002731CF7E|nr:AarF/UbiB family protein [Methylobacter sp.]MDP1666047.1 AarF/UbiB family protein [Methylobacter sp.]MDP1969953.1 AarF/UbiB family protein [Methylobacter sp.]
MAILNTAKRALQFFRIGLAAKKLQRTQNETERLLAKQAIAGLFADARGITMKIGQLFAGNDGTTPFQELVEGIEPLPLKAMIPQLEMELGQKVKTVFRSIDKAIAAASLGQVHLAELKNGDKVAVKIRYPDIADAVDAELRLVGLMPGVGPVNRWGFDLDAYKKSLRDNMHRELDYRSEAQRQDYFGRTVHVPGLKVPDVYKDLCSERVLVQSRAEGVLIYKVSDWSEQDRLAIGQTLMMTLFKSLFVAGEVHGDPHPGNVFYSHDENGLALVTLLDYGCTISIAEPRRLALLKLIVGCRERSPVKPLDCFAALGFDSKKLTPISGSLPALCQILFRPFLLNHAFNPEEWQLGQGVNDLLGDYRWWFRSAGPSDLFLLMRAFQGLIQQLQQLDVKLPWWTLLRQAVGPELIQQAMAYELPAIKHEPTVIALGFDQQATLLCVRVTESGEQRVSVKMPAEAVLDLEHLIPEDVLARIISSGTIDLKQLGESIRANGIIPQQLFVFEDGRKTYRVWLE